jgi:hypothetical protein
MLHKSIVLVVAYAALSTAMPTRLFKKLSTECPRNENWNGRECVCDRGFERTREGCVEPPATVRCGRNEIFNGRECVCDRGFEMTREGCVEPEPTVRCGRNEVATERGGCECARGFEMTREGCVEPPVRCGRNEVANERGGCECARGFEITREGCVAIVTCGRNEVKNTRGGCDCAGDYEMTRAGCVEPPGDDADDAEDDDAPLENMRGDSWCESKKARKSTICSKTNKRGAFRYRDEWCVKMCASRD